MFGDGPQPLTEATQKPKKEKVHVQGETQPAVRGDKELPPNFMEKHPVQVRNNQMENIYFLSILFSAAE